jgi:hypothetical protein
MTTATMDALIVHAPSRYSIERVPVPVPQPYEALCQVRAVAICGTDTHIINGDFPGFWPQALPFTPGHEWADDIMALGQHSEQFGQAGKFFGPEEAEDYIAGYTVFNDITARDIQRREMQSGVFSFSKAIDTFCPIGPWIVTRDEVPDAQALAMELRVNGQVRQRGNTAQMLISIPHLVAYHSAQDYSAGDILTTGTISGVAAVQPNPFEFYLQPGDSIEAEIEGVGMLRNHVVPWAAAHNTPPYSTDLYSSTS